MASLPYPGTPHDPVGNLIDAIHICQKKWGDDPAYAEAAYKLRQVERELDAIVASPGHRAALRSLPANSAGQDPHNRSESPSKAQGSGY